MSWLFGSSKKKDLPPVTVDVTPIENDFYLISQPSKGPQSLYPDLNNPRSHNPTSLPYNLSPAATATATVTPEPSNQLESIPFRIAPQLQGVVNATNHETGISLDEFMRSLSRVKEFSNSAECNYDFNLERRIIREAKMVNGHLSAFQ